MGKGTESGKAPSRPEPEARPMPPVPVRKRTERVSRRTRLQ